MRSAWKNAFCRVTNLVRWWRSLELSLINIAIWMTNSFISERLWLSRESLEPSLSRRISLWLYLDDFSNSSSNLGGEWGQSSLWGHNDGRILAVLCYHAQLHQAQHWRVLGSSFIRSRCKSFCCLQKWLFFVWILFCSLFSHSTHTFLLWSLTGMNWKWI